MALVNLKKILDDASRNKYAIPAFDTLDYFTAETFIQIAEEKNSPAIMMVGESTLSYLNTKRLFPFLIHLAESATVPVALQLDHGKSMDTIIHCINSGFTSIMFDGSALSLEENILATQKIVDISHKANVSVEAELGHVGGGEGDFDGSEVDKNNYTDPQSAKLFIQSTKIDALAIAFGTVHGTYKGTPKLDFERLMDIKQQSSVPLVMHGASGLSDDDFKKAVENGISKINIFTEISLAATEVAFQAYNKASGKLHFAHMLGASKLIVENKFNHFFNLLQDNTPKKYF